MCLSAGLLHLGLAFAATICCNTLMDLPIETIVQHGGVSAAYARMLRAGKRTASLALALRLYDATGERVGPLQGRSQDEIDAFRKLPQAA